MMNEAPLSEDIDNNTGSAQLFQESDVVRARIAWYYFVGGLTQQEIARKFNITRLRVNKLVGQLRAEGLVRTEIRLPLIDCVELEGELQSKYGLVSARVVPHLDDENEQQRAIGEAAGEILDSMLVNGMGLGIGWGRTLAAAIPRLTPRRFERAWVATLMGGLTQGPGTSSYELVTAFAKALGSACYYLAAPVHFPTEESRLLLESHHGIADVLNRIRTADCALMSCGELSSRSQLVATDAVSENLATLKACGAVGDLLGSYLDEEGNPLSHPLNRRLMALRPEHLKNLPETMLASGGVHKTAIVRAVLRGGYVKRLVTDERCARVLLGASG
jgi:DNA-binding transcriptional regulator LsrR (DeoR family)